MTGHGLTLRHEDHNDHKDHQPNWLFVICLAVVIFVPEREPWAAAQAQPPQQRPPVFRAGTHYVRVDAYPTSKDGRSVTGLTKDDFEIFEDGKPQTVEDAQYVTFETWTPDAERRDPPTKEAGFEMAGDASYRVFGIVIDRAAFDLVGWNVMHQPLADFIERNLGPHDLFGLVTSRSDWQDFVLGQKSTAIVSQLGKRDWWTTKDDYDDQEWALVSCGLESLIPRSRADRTYSLLEGLVTLLGAIREERKSIVYVADGLPDGGPVNAAMSGGSGTPQPPAIGVTPGGRLGTLPRGDAIGGPSPNYCNEQRMTLTAIDFDERFRELLKSGRQANVAFYPISPKGLQGIDFTPRGGADLAGYHRGQRQLDMLRSLASETDGVAIVNTNDLRGGLNRIAADMQAYYVLGYYTTNTKWDGGLRSIKVRLKPKHDVIRARRQYRAPTEAEIAAMSRATAPPAPAPAEISPLAAVLIGQPIAYRVGPRMAPERVSSFQFERTDRIRVEWPVLGTLDRREARLLDRNGRPLPVDLPVSEDEAAHVVRVELALSALARGEYAIELTAGSGSSTEHRRLAFVMK
jgi:VWFA-related protein